MDNFESKLHKAQIMALHERSNSVKKTTNILGEQFILGRFHKVSFKHNLKKEDPD